MSDSREGSGAYVYEGAGGVIEDCQMTGNKLAGVEIKGQGTAPKLRKCQIHKNGYAAIRVHQSASGTVENCDLRDNPRGPWNIDKGCTVTKRNNTE